MTWACVSIVIEIWEDLHHHPGRDALGQEQRGAGLAHVVDSDPADSSRGDRVGEQPLRWRGSNTVPMVVGKTRSRSVQHSPSDSPSASRAAR